MQDGIGVITANYNNGYLINDYLQGLTGQSLKPDIVCYVDDKSTGDDLKIVNHLLTSRGYKGVDKRYGRQYDVLGMEFRLVSSEKNGGPAVARNIALSHMMDKCKYLCVYDSDDVYYPNKILKSVEMLKKYPHCYLVYSDYDVFNVKTSQFTREYKEPYSMRRLYSECIISNNSVYTSDIIRKVGTYDESIRGPEDYDLWLRISEVGFSYHIPESLYIYRITGNNITITTPSEKFAQEVNKVHRKKEARLNAYKKKIAV